MDSVTQLDWASFRTKAQTADVMDSLQTCFSVPQYVRYKGTGKGWNGYAESRRIEYMGKPVGLVAFGGEHMRDWTQVNLTGDCMEHLGSDAAESLTCLYEDLSAQPKRTDIALTTMDGSVSIKTVEDEWHKGGFTSGGRRPKLRSVASSTITDGQTRYIGDRTAPKFCRAYEKGYELANQFALQLRHQTGERIDVDGMKIDDVPIEDIFRVEVEFKPEPELCPLDILVNRDHYFAGAYPYLAKLVISNPQTFRLTAPRLGALTMERALAECRRQYGDALFTALMLHHGDITAVWDKIVGFKHSQSLIEAGVLLAMSEYA